MEYLTKEEVAMIFEYRLKRRVLKVKKPMQFICTICKSPGYGSYLHVGNSLAKPKNSRIILDFDAEHPDDCPDIEQIRNCVERDWDFLSKIERSNYEKELKQIQENNT